MQPRARVPTHADVTNFLEAFLPPSLNPATQAREVPYLYNTVRTPYYSPTTQLASRVVFSITPTSGVYAALNAPSPKSRTPVCFLHRPFNLDRRAVRRGSLVLASHKSFDEHLTVGWNEALARRLDLDVEGAICIRGYKGDDQRKIGLVARLGKSSRLQDIVKKVRAEFMGAGEVFEPQDTTAVLGRSDEDGVGSSISGHEEVPIHVVAIMNAFHPEEVERVLFESHKVAWINDTSDGSHILYLTGAARPPGIAALAKVRMPAVCVGHVACEEWGVRYLASRTRYRWPELEVVEIFEEEEPRQAQCGKRKEQDEAGVIPTRTVDTLRTTSLPD